MSKSISVNLNETVLNSIAIVRDNLFPESVEYNPNTDQFLLSSVTEGSIYTTNEDGSVSPFIEDERLISSIGLAINEEQNRLFVLNSDGGSSIRSSPETENQLATLGIFNLSTGELIDYVDLSSLRPEEPHFVNDIDIDDEGNAYVTDSLSPIIYKVDPEGNPSILLEDEQFAGEGFNLNGIIAHPNNYLIVTDSNDGLLYKVPLDNPEQFTQVQLDRSLGNTDGLLLADEDELVVVSNENAISEFNDESSNQVFSLQSDDNWESAEIIDELDLGNDAFPTTANILDGEILVLDSKFDIFLAGGTTDEFAIQTVGLIDTQNQGENINATDIVPIFGSNNSDQLFADTGDLIFGGNGSAN
ncbi:MAG: SMP-30/gluconolactonase/LRE family protein [Pleurocapsa sp. MO_192.B19]|nr:SMP-30/gluconolactonase/LRE family protein [Pleurocapsa sp. MO_192.B19]